MQSAKKGVKPTNNPKDYMLRVRLDCFTLNNLDAICSLENESRSRVVRGLINEKYKKIKK